MGVKDPLDSLVGEAVAFLRENIGLEIETFVGFSGGKDSIVIAELMRLADLPCRLLYSSTGIDPPELVKFIKVNYPETVFLKPSRSFYKMILSNNPPANFSRWCCRELKKRPASRLPYIKRVLGIRKEESTKRSKYPRVNPRDGQILLYPIFHWKEWEVWEFIKQYDLPYPSLYDDGFDRLGCVVCPYHSGKNGGHHDLYRQRWPHQFRIFEKYVGLWFDKRKAQGRTMHHENAADFLADWYNGNVRYYKDEAKNIPTASNPPVK